VVPTTPVPTPLGGVGLVGVVLAMTLYALSRKE
jgi:hypothetical protein